MTDPVRQLGPEEVLVHPAAIMLCDLSKKFYDLKWNMGTGGGVSMQMPGSPLILLSPSGIHKELMQPIDLFVWDTRAQDYVYRPAGGRSPSASSVLFLWLHEKHGAGAVIHTHSLYSNLATGVRSTAGHWDDDAHYWSIAHQEYVKAIPNWSTGKARTNYERFLVPIIRNQATEDQLFPEMVKVLKEVPDTPCFLVKDHGAYHFGRDMGNCKAQAECIEYLFELSFHLQRRAGIIF